MTICAGHYLTIVYTASLVLTTLTLTLQSPLIAKDFLFEAPADLQ